jgi:hypothetical protein
MLAAPNLPLPGKIIAEAPAQTPLVPPPRDKKLLREPPRLSQVFRISAT